MTTTFPEGVTAQGNKQYTFVPTLADPANPTLAEVTGATAVDVTGYMYSGGGSGGSQNTGASPRRVWDKKTRQKLGNVTQSIDALAYSYDPQADDTAPANKAKATCAEDTTGYLFERLGLDGQNVAKAATQKFNMTHVKLGFQVRGATGDDSDEFAEFNITQQVEMLADTVYDITLATS